MSRSGGRRLDKQLARKIINGVRMSRGETLAEVAAAVGLSTAALSRKLNDRYKEGLTETEIGRLAAHLDLSGRDRDLLRQSFGYQQPPTNLPAAISSFVGRSSERAAVRRRVLDHRLVTLSGEGGSGKTRLALEVARDLREHFQDGVWLAELAALSEPQQIMPAVASALRVQERLGQSLDSIVTEHLRRRSLLLVLDNCEHLIAACADLAANLLRLCAGLTILATSREALRITGESVWRIPPLAFPQAAENTFTPTDAAAFDAVALFVTRASERTNDFALTETNVGAVVDLCRRLDGNPLALELAAARLNVFDVQQLVTGLSDRFAVLTAGSRVAHQRHQTLREAIAWSYNLLSPSERMLFRRLAVFAGGFTVPDAGQVCEPGDLDVSEGIAALVEKSLVRPVGSFSGVRRLGMLETVRAFALAELEGSGEGDAVRRRHLDYMVDRSEACAREFRRNNDIRQLERIEAEIDNLHAAIQWATVIGDVEAGARLVHATHDIAGAQLTHATGGFAWRAGQQGEHLAWADALLALPQAAERTQARARLLVTDVSAFTGRAAATLYRPRMEEAIAICRELGDWPLLAEALRLLVWHLYLDDDLVAARTLADESIALARTHGNDLVLTHALNIRGLIALAEGDGDTVRWCAIEGMAWAEQVGSRPLVGNHLRLLAELAARRTDYTEAHALYERVLELHLTGGRSPRVAQTLCQWACVFLDQNHLDEAASRLSESITLSRDAGPVVYLLNALEATAELAERSGLVVDAARILGSTEATGRALYVRRCPCDRPRRERARARVRERLGPEAFARAWADGSRMDRDATIAVGLMVASRKALTEVA